MKIHLCAALGSLLLAAPSSAQLLQPLQPVLAPVTGTLGSVGQDVETVSSSVRALAADRLSRLTRAVRQSGAALEMTSQGPAVRSRIIAVDPGMEAIATARALGLSVTSEESIDGLGFPTLVLSLPQGMSLEATLAKLRRGDPGGIFTADHIYFATGAAPGKAIAPLAASRPARGGVGIIDGGVAAHASLTGAIEQHGFASGAPLANAHATALASLVAGKAGIRGPAPNVPLLVADIYGNDRAGGSALAIARALGWMVVRQSPVVAMSLVGPPNPLLERAVRVAQARGITLVAAVGNDGPSAPLSYPASYPGVVAVSAVDGRNRVLIEAGRASHVDFVAPGADMLAANAAGGSSRVRGTSFAVPFVAALAWNARQSGGASPYAQLSRQAIDLDRPGPDAATGHGLLCRDCRTTSAH